MATEKPDLDKHIDPNQAEKLKQAEELSRVQGEGNERAEQIHFATESQRAAAKQAEANGAGGTAPAATPGISDVREQVPEPDSARDYGPVDRILMAELHELKALTDKQSAYQLAIIALLGVCAAFLAVRMLKNVQPPDITGG